LPSQASETSLLQLPGALLEGVLGLLPEHLGLHLQPLLQVVEAALLLALGVLVALEQTVQVGALALEPGQAPDVLVLQVLQAALAGVELPGAGLERLADALVVHHDVLVEVLMQLPSGLDEVLQVLIVGVQPEIQLLAAAIQPGLHRLQGDADLHAQAGELLHLGPARVVVLRQPSRRVVGARVHLREPAVDACALGPELRPEPLLALLVEPQNLRQDWALDGSLDPVLQVRAHGGLQLREPYDQLLQILLNLSCLAPEAILDAVEAIRETLLRGLDHLGHLR